MNSSSAVVVSKSGLIVKDADTYGRPPGISSLSWGKASQFCFVSHTSIVLAY